MKVRGNKLKYVDVSSQGVAYVIDVDDNIYRYSSGTLYSVNGELEQVESNNGIIIGVKSNDMIYRATSSSASIGPINVITNTYLLEMIVALSMINMLCFIIYFCKRYNQYYNSRSVCVSSIQHIKHVHWTHKSIGSPVFE